MKICLQTKLKKEIGPASLDGSAFLSNTIRLDGFYGMPEGMAANAKKYFNEPKIVGPNGQPNYLEEQQK